MPRMQVLLWNVVLAGAIGCHAPEPPSVDLGPPARVAPAPEPPASASATASAPVEPPPAPTAAPAPAPIKEAVDVPAPGPGWERDEPSQAFGYVSFYFGAGVIKDPGVLRPLAAWKRGERGRIRIFRRIERSTGAPVTIEPPRVDLLPRRQLAGGALAYELQSDGVQFHWVTSGSIVLEAEDSPLSKGLALAAQFRPWAAKAAAALATPREEPRGGW